MTTLEHIHELWQDVNADVVRLMGRVQSGKHLLFQLVRKSRFESFIPEPGRILQEFDPSRHNGLCARLDAVSKTLDMLCRGLDEQNVYRASAEKIQDMRKRIAVTQRILDQWYCDGAETAPITSDKK